MSCSEELTDTVLPVARHTAAMGNGDDKHEIRLDSVKNAVRESPGETTTNVIVEIPTARETRS